MSKVSSKAEHLIRAALKGIEKNPESWGQDNWVLTPEDRERCGLQPSACGTAYCLGGWMMLYDGWKHEARRTMHSRHLRNVWIKGDVETDDPYDAFLKNLVYGDDSPGFSETIFDGELSMPEILARIDEQLEINFEEDCPCLTEADVCNLQGCPCGTHTTALEFPASAFTSSREAINRIIEKFALDCRKVGDMITVEQVLADKVLMDAFAAMHCAGEDSMVHTVTMKANRRINELRVRLEGEIREITQSRDRLVARNSELQQSASSRFPYTTAMIRHNEEREQVIRKLQGQVDELHAGTRDSPEFVKLKAKVKTLEAHTQALILNNKDLQNRLEGARNELHAQKRVNAQVQTIGRQEGFQRAVAAWQKALDIVKKEEGL